MQADKAIEQLFKTYELTSFDRKMLHENFYDIIRWWRLLVEANSGNASLQDDNLARIIGINLVRKERNLPHHPALRKINPRTVAARLEKISAAPAVRHSLSEWMEERCSSEITEGWDALAASLNDPAPLAVRINTLKASKEDIMAFFEETEVNPAPSAIAHDGLVLGEFVNVYRTPVFRDGWIEVQDEGSQYVSEFMDVKPGMRVVDACAGAGGKTLHLAALMKNKGKVVALDIFPKKLEELKRRAKRAGAENIEIRLIESSKTVKRMKDTADRVLIDAPCSGLGVLRRNPDIKWRLSPEELEKLIPEQRQLLKQFSALVKPGGKLVYATCSILPSENEKQVEHFLSEHPEFSLEKETWLLPGKDGCDGFYMARLVRKPV